MVILSNAFSLQMVPEYYDVRISEVSIDEALRLLKLNNFKSIVGHQDTAVILTKLLGIEVVYNRESIMLRTGDLLIVAQYVGGRLPEGATELPSDAKFRWFIAQVNEK